MVYPGHASRACETCILRRVKCDETRPYCCKCANAKRICTGYSTSNEVTSNRSAMSLHAQQQQPQLYDCSMKTHAAIAPLLGSLSPSTPLFYDRAALLFAESFLSSSQQQQPTFPLNFLSGLDSILIQSGDNMTLRISFDIFSKGYHSLSKPALAKDERRGLLGGYQAAISATKTSLSSQHDRSPDLQIAVYLLALYEVCLSISIAKENLAAVA